LIKSDLYFTHALRNVIHAALVGITVGLGPLRDALVYAPNGAELCQKRRRPPLTSL